MGSGRWLVSSSGERPARRHQAVTCEVPDSTGPAGDRDGVLGFGREGRCGVEDPLVGGAIA